VSGDLEALAHYAGQSVGLVKNKKSVQEILDEVIIEAIKRLQVCQNFIS
jgi:hypothetical protein